MNAIPPTMTPPSAPARGSFGRAANDWSLKWAALHDAANVVAELAGLDSERTTGEIRNFPALNRYAAPWRRDLAERAIDEMAAVMEPGIVALLGINARGADPRAAALALWREFSDARDAVLALLLPADAIGPRRNA